MDDAQSQDDQPPHHVHGYHYGLTIPQVCQYPGEGSQEHHGQRRDQKQCAQGGPGTGKVQNQPGQGQIVDTVHHLGNQTSPKEQPEIPVDEQTLSQSLFLHLQSHPLSLQVSALSLSLLGQPLNWLGMGNPSASRRIQRRNRLKKRSSRVQFSST